MDGMKMKNKRKPKKLPWILKEKFSHEDDSVSCETPVDSGSELEDAVPYIPTEKEK